MKKCRAKIYPVNMTAFDKKDILFLCRCIQDVNTGLSKVLGYITSVKGLAAIRDEVWELLHEVGIISLYERPRSLKSRFKGNSNVLLLRWIT